MASTDPHSNEYSKVHADEADNVGDPLDGEEEESSKRMLYCAIIVMASLFALGVVDSISTQYLQTWCEMLAHWTLDNAPWSFIVFEFVIFVFVILLIPYGLLAVLSGALFFQKYGTLGIFYAAISLFISTLAAGCVCFALARSKFRKFVKRKLDTNPSVRPHNTSTSQYGITTTTTTNKSYVQLEN